MHERQQQSVSGEIALVTGAAKRIGAAIATELHAAGMQLAVHYRDSAVDAHALCERLNAARPVSAAAFQADLIDAEAPAKLVAAVVSRFGGLDLLVNNASTFYATPPGEISEAAWSDLIGSNLKAPMFLSQAALPYLEKTGGNIINIIDIHARRPLRGYPVYSAAKAGLAMLTRSLAKDLAPTIRVNGVAPGAIDWPKDGLSAAAKQKILSQVPLGRAGNPSDVAKAVVFLVRDAGYVTGQIMTIDGGRSIGW